MFLGNLFLKCTPHTIIIYMPLHHKYNAISLYSPSLSCKPPSIPTLLAWGTEWVCGDVVGNKRLNLASDKISDILILVEGCQDAHHIALQPHPVVVDVILLQGHGYHWEGKEKLHLDKQLFWRSIKGHQGLD